MYRLEEESIVDFKGSRFTERMLIKKTNWINFYFHSLLFMSLTNLRPLWPYCSRLAAILRKIRTVLRNKKRKPSTLSLTRTSFSPQSFLLAKHLCSMSRVKNHNLCFEFKIVVYRIFESKDVVTCFLFPHKRQIMTHLSKRLCF